MFNLFKKRKKKKEVDARLALMTPDEILQKYDIYVDDGEKWVPFEEYSGEVAVITDEGDIPIKEYFKTCTHKIPVMKKNK